MSEALDVYLFVLAVLGVSGACCAAIFAVIAWSLPDDEEVRRIRNLAARVILIAPVWPLLIIPVIRTLWRWAHE